MCPLKKTRTFYICLNVFFASLDVKNNRKKHYSIVNFSGIYNVKPIPRNPFIVPLHKIEMNYLLYLIEYIFLQP